MRIHEIRIKNFRSLLDVVIPVDPETTVIIGENNAGKSAVLDALRIALPQRGTGRRGLSVGDYDFHLKAKDEDPQKSSPIEIDIELRENKPDEWPSNLVSELNEVIQTNLTTGTDYIYLRMTSQYSKSSKSYETQWHFLNASREPQTVGRAASPSHFVNFSKYVVVFYLSALRDAFEEFSSRSQFWGQLLKAVDIPDQKRTAVERAIENLNSELLKLDPSLAKVTSTLQKIEKVIIQGVNQSVSIRALPVRVLDLLSRSEIAVQGRGSDVRFPLTRHGQGMQSIAVLFLFEAFVENLLSTVYKKETEPILCLEEPEAHLHPQAIRALWTEIQKTGTQTIVTTHSPYLAQNVPLRKLRLLRKVGNATSVVLLKDRFEANAPRNAALDAFLAKHGLKYSYSDLTMTLTVVGFVTRDEYRELLACYTNQSERVSVHPVLKALKLESNRFIEDNDLNALQNNAQRIRGEIFFSRAWLLCEGQSDYILFHYFAELLGIPLDPYNIAVIDYQNNGSAGQFAALARAFEFPWHLICDNDLGGNDHIQTIAAHRFETAEIAKRVHQLPAGDIEAYLVSEGFREDLATVAVPYTKEDLSMLPRDAAFDQRLLLLLRDHKGEWPLQLIILLRANKCPSSRVPAFFRQVLQEIVREANA